MSITPNNTLPNEWESDITYSIKDKVYYGNIIYESLVNNNLNHIPASPDSMTYWRAIDIYKKNLTVMPHGHYSGDESFWDRDNIYVDANGDVYINGLNSGINVRGPQGTATVNFDSLTPDQREQLRGPQGIQGPEGPEGPQGPQGPMGEVILTPEQKEELKGDEGKSAYDIWVEQGGQGDETAFLTWLRTGVITLDTELSRNSPNGITNAAITIAFDDYRNQVNTLISQMQARIIDLENRLNDKDTHFKFGVTTEGEYGYYIDGTDEIVPFAQKNTDLSSSSAELNAPSVMQAQYGYGQVNAMVTTIDSQLTSPTSLIGDVSGNAEDYNTIYATNVTPMDVNDALNQNRYIYKNGAFTDGFNFNLYSMDEDYLIEEDLTSANQEDIEGIWIPPYTPSAATTTINFVIEPVDEGDSLHYEIGKFTNEAGQLPDLVDPGTYRTYYENGTINQRTTISLVTDYAQGIYFASTQQCKYRIVEIYLR